MLYAWSERKSETEFHLGSLFSIFSFTQYSEKTIFFFWCYFCFVSVTPCTLSYATSVTSTKIDTIFFFFLINHKSGSKESRRLTPKTSIKCDEHPSTECRKLTHGLSPQEVSYIHTVIKVFTWFSPLIENKTKPTHNSLI